jgi:phosphoribosylglycinamide formyltransferase 1
MLMENIKLNIGFYLSSKATRFNKILDENNLDLIKNIKVVFSDDVQNLYLKDKLDKLNIKYVLVNYKDINVEKGRKNLFLSDKLLGTLQENNVDYCFSFGAHILKGKLLEVYENRIINFHPSILPAFPGIRSIDQAIEAKSNLLGNTAHFIDAGVDTGPIILQSVIPAIAFYEGGYDAILDIQIEMLNKIFTLLRNNRVKVFDGKVIIEEADYNSYFIFPCI